MGGQVPLGYRSEGRTLIIDNDRAKIIQRIFDLFQEHRNIRLVRDALKEDTSICSRSKAFSRGHLQFILSNPVYAGLIRHKQQNYEGLHEPIIDPGRWKQIQTLPRDAASKPRGVANRVTSTSHLTGKLFDETGDRLTPTHANSKGKRYRYHVSHRLIRNTADKNGKNGGHSSDFRIPADSFKRYIEQAILSHLKSQTTVKCMSSWSVDEIQMRQNILGDLERYQSSSDASVTLHLIDGVTLGDKTMEIRLIAKGLADLLKVPVSAVPGNLLNFTIPANMRKRGIETKFILDDGTSQQVDETLLKNIANANLYYDAIKNGETIEQIAIRENVSSARILKRLELAFLCPAIAKTVVEGSQPIGLTTKWFQNRILPLDWSAQAELINRL